MDRLLSLLGIAQKAGKTVSGTFMCETELPLGDEDGEPITYAEAFVKLGREFDVNPLMLAARVRQEQGGSGTNRLISGTVPGYEGYYNYFNIEAAGSIDAKAIAEALPALVYDGAVTGSISFDEIGDANKDMAYVKKANTETGAFDFVKTQTVAGL